MIIVHFSKVFNEMFKKEFLKLNQTKFQNLYVLKLATSSIILDMCKFQNIQNKIIKIFIIPLIINYSKKFYFIQKI